MPLNHNFESFKKNDFHNFRKFWKWFNNIYWFEIVLMGTTLPISVHDAKFPRFFKKNGQHFCKFSHLILMHYTYYFNFSIKIVIFGLGEAGVGIPSITPLPSTLMHGTDDRLKIEQMISCPKWKLKGWTPFWSVIVCLYFNISKCSRVLLLQF